MELMGGFMLAPNRESEKLVGAHCMLAVGYIKNYNNQEYLIVQNSWGTNWGDRGYCYIPLSYIMSNDSFDFWTVRLTETSDEYESDPVEKPRPEPVIEPTPEPVVEPVVEPPVIEVVAPVVPPAPEPVVVVEKKKSKITPFHIVMLVLLILILIFIFG
jgi:hypothetical protein